VENVSVVADFSHPGVAGFSHMMVRYSSMRFHALKSILSQFQMRSLN
jgi:hypothetical protein